MSFRTHLATVRTIGFGLVGSLVLVVAMATTAFAQYPPAASLSVSCTSETPAPGDTVTCTISGAPGDVDLEVLATSEFEGDVTVLLDTTVTTNAAGEAVFSFTAPDQVGAEITITISGEAVDGTLVLGIVVTAADMVIEDDGELARTGGETNTLLLLGLSVAALGVGAVAMGRRREMARVDA